MKSSIFLPLFLLLQAFLLVSSTPSPKNVDIAAHPHEYNPSQPFTITCTVDVSPSNAGYGVGFKLNDTDIGWWTNFDGFGFKWGSEPSAAYIVDGSAVYPTFTATILGGYPQTRGVYKCLAYYGSEGDDSWGYGSIETSIGYNTNGSSALTSGTAILTVLCILLLKAWF